MSYPQPQASREILDGQEYFRLTTPIDSSGDVYEMDGSALAFAIGPESDISKARITYYDPSQPNRASSFIVSVDNPFVGRVDAALANKFPSSNTSGRILISPEEVINNEIQNNFSPGIDTNNGYFSLIKPVLDIQGFLSKPTFGPRRRSPRNIRGKIGFNNGAGGVAANSILAVPTYGRRYLSLAVGRGYTGAFASADNRVRLIGVTLLNEAASFLTGTPIKMISAEIAPYANIPHAPSGSVASSAAIVEYSASADGIFDYIFCQFSLTANVNIAVDASQSNNGMYFNLQMTDEEV